MFVGNEAAAPMISVIIPFHNAERYLARCLQAITSSPYHPFELILVDDGSTDSSASIARRYPGHILSFPSPHGPAYARNRGAARARGEILFFTDSDVICAAGTLQEIGRLFLEHPDLDAVIGSYDDDPPAANFISRYKNLTHHYVHQRASTEASTFWTGCGAIRRAAFVELHGFDESYRRASIEDIELGYRLRAAGRRIVLRKDLVVKHAKAWTLRSLLRSDFWDRAIPWTVLQLSSGRILNDLNVSRAQRTASLFACMAAAVTLLAFWDLRWLALSGSALAAVVWMNRDLYRFYLRKGKSWFALRAVAMHLVYYLYSLAGFAIGSCLYLSSRWRWRRRRDRETPA